MTAKQLGIDLINFRTSTSGLKFYSSVEFLRRVSSQHETDVLLRHNRKLRELYNGDIYFAETKSNINLSRYELAENEEKLLNKGLNFGIKGKRNEFCRKIEMEKLFFDITTAEREGKATVVNNDDFKIKLKNFVKYNPRETKDNLSPGERNAIKNLRNNEIIVIKRPDKGGGVVILDREYYNSSLAELLQDTDKFLECSSK